MPKKGYKPTPQHRATMSKARGGHASVATAKKGFLSQTTVRKKAGGKVGDGKIADHIKGKVTNGSKTPGPARLITAKAHELKHRRAAKNK